MAVVGRPFLLAIDWTFGAVHVQNHPPMRGVSHGPLHPGSIEMRESFHVLLVGQHLSLKSAHGVGAGRRLLRGLAAGDHSHGRVPSQPVCIVGIFIARQAAVHRLAQQRHQEVLYVASIPTFLQVAGSSLGQSQGIVQLATRQQPAIRGESGTVELQAYAGIKMDFQRLLCPFTHEVPPSLSSHGRPYPSVAVG
jgi:hypothetical protein